MYNAKFIFIYSSFVSNKKILGLLLDHKKMPFS